MYFHGRTAAASTAGFFFCWSKVVMLLLAVLVGPAPAVAKAFPDRIHIRAGVIHAPPFAMIEQDNQGKTLY
jgi:hypothetical protein